MLSEKVKMQKRKYYLENKEKYKKWLQESYERHKEERKGKMRIYYKNNKEEFKGWSKEYSTTEGGKEAHSRASVIYRIKNILKYKAHTAVNNAIRLGKLIKKPCKKCGKLKVDGHHYLGYEEQYWLVVEWYCRKHHKIKHANINI